MKIVYTDRGFYHFYLTDDGCRVYESSGNTPGIWWKSNTEATAVLFLEGTDYTCFIPKVRRAFQLLWKIHFLVGDPKAREAFHNTIEAGASLESFLEDSK